MQYKVDLLVMVEKYHLMDMVDEVLVKTLLEMLNFLVI